MSEKQRPPAPGRAWRPNHLENQARNYLNPSHNSFQLDIYRDGYKAGFRRAADILALVPSDRDLLQEVLKKMFGGSL